MDLTPGFEIVTMDESVDQHLLNGAFRVFTEVHPIGRALVPRPTGMESNKVFCILEQLEKSAAVLPIVGGIHNARRHVESVPSRTEYARMADRRLVRHQRARVGHDTSLGDKAEREEIVFRQLLAACRLIAVLERDEREVGCAMSAEARNAVPLLAGLLHEELRQGRAGQHHLHGSRAVMESSLIAHGE